MATDKPEVHASLSALEKETATVEPFRLALKNNKIITFPSPLDLAFDEADEFLEAAESGDIRRLLKRWLSADDYEALRESKMSLGAINKLGEKLASHYSAVLGTSGNADAS